MLHSISWTVAASRGSDTSSTTYSHSATFADDGAYAAHEGATGRVCHSSSLDKGNSVTCQSEAADVEKTRVDYVVKVILCFASKVGVAAPSLAAPQLDPITLCLPHPSIAYLLPSAAAAASFNCPALSSSPATAALVQTCAFTVNLSSSYPPIMIPDRDAAAAAAAAATAANLRVSAPFVMSSPPSVTPLQHLNGARARSRWANHSSIKCSGLEHLYSFGGSIQVSKVQHSCAL